MKKICVFLDNGHGVNTPGKCSPNGLFREYKWTRDIVKQLRVKLNNIDIMTYTVTPEETDISLTTRVNRVNKKYAELKAKGYECVLISVHNNAAGGDGKWHDANGWSVFVSKNSSSKSKKFAAMLYEECEKFNLKGNRWVPACKYWEANYTILAKTNCPAVLTENMFQDNKNDYNLLNKQEFNEKIVDLHVNGILKYIDEYCK
jgi:N-acetylmuramoyl-L-alanine amidase